MMSICTLVSKCRHSAALALLLMAAVLFGCTSSTDTVSMTDERPATVAFDTFVQQVGPTRASAFYPLESAQLTTSTLRDVGFGVFAHHSGNADYDRQEAFNFMYNQQVEAVTGGTLSGNWIYSPVKYWPNDNQPADMQDAQGSRAHSYLHFFAYAPYQPLTDSQLASGLDRTADDDAYGITAMTPNASTDASLSYRAFLDAPGRGVDLLWAKRDYMYKTMPSGEGYVDGRVTFLFQHALARMGVVVQGLFDHATTSDDATAGYSSQRDAATRILIDKVEIRDVPERATMFVAPKQADDSYDRLAASPSWRLDHLSAISIDSETDEDVNPVLAMYHAAESQPPASGTAADAAAWFAGLPSGVDATEKPLFTDASLSYLFPPCPSTPFTVRLVYYVITYDERLALNTPPYFSIVKNDVTATFSKILDLESNKYYTLRLLPGLTSAKFEVVDVTDADVPVVMDAVVKEWDVDTREIDVESPLLLVSTTPWSESRQSVTRSGETLTDLMESAEGFGLYSDNPLVINRQVTWDETKSRWTYGDGSLLWPNNTVNTSANVYAYAPFKDTPTYSFSNGVISFSSATANVDTDLLWAKGTVNTDGTVDLNFNHALAKLTVTAPVFNTGYMVSSFSLSLTDGSGRLYTGGDLSLADGAWSSLTSTSGSLALTAGTPCMLIPGTDGTLSLQLTISYSSSDFGTEQLRVPITLRQGEHTMLTVTVDNNHEVVIN